MKSNNDVGHCGTIQFGGELMGLKYFEPTIQTSWTIVERHPEKMGIRMWINGARASVIQDRAWV